MSLSIEQKNLNAYLFQAIDICSHENMAEFIKRGADVNCSRKNMHGNLSPLMYALRKDLYTTARMLIEYGADPNVTNNVNGEYGVLTPIMLTTLEAGSPGVRQMAEFLIKHGADINKVASNGTTTLTYMITKNYIKSVDLLIQLGASLKVGISYNDDALHMTKMIKNAEMTALIEHNLLKISGQNVNLIQADNTKSIAKRARI